MGSSEFLPVVVVSAVEPGGVSNGSSTDALFSWYWGPPSAVVILVSTLVVNLNTPVDTLIASAMVAVKGVLLMKLLSRCRSVDPTPVVATPLEPPIGIS
ncbi:hypothetical protein HanHA300_Chr04g0152661 [Helianthus annuus]|nr:hypothetical protein HanHA300_Chr04g0152661 [Helianthus annuus]